MAVGTWAGLTPTLRHAQAELPPLSPERLRSDSDAIVEGTVQKVTSKVVPAGGPESLNRASTAHILVERVTKGSGIRPGKKVAVRYWRSKRRPAGWVGPGGQYRPLQENARVRLYLSGDRKTGYSLLVPNGWVPLPKPVGKTNPEKKAQKG